MRFWSKRDVMAVSPIIATIILVAITVVLSAAAYIMFINFSADGGSTYGSFTEIRQDPSDGNTYIAVIGPTTDKVDYSQCKASVNGDLTAQTLDQYLGKSRAWNGPGVNLYVVDIAGNVRVDNGDMIFLSFTTLTGVTDVDLSMIYMPEGSLLASVLFTAAGSIDADLDMFFDFSSGDPMSDLTGKQADATTTPASWAAPQVANVNGVGCLDLDPNSRTLRRYARVVDSPSLDPTASIYVETRVKVIQAPNTMESGATLVAKGSDYYRIALSGGSGASMNQYFQFSVRIADGVGLRSVNSVTTIQSGEWYTVAGSYDAATGQLSIYVNGVKERTVVVTGHHALSITNGQLTMGYSTGNKYFVGYIDWVKLSGT
jgi:flagellin-like protein